MARVERPLSCGLRACPDCARQLAAAKVRALGAAVEHVAPAVRARAVGAQLAEARREAEALDREVYWSKRPKHPRAEELRARAARDAGDARWRAARVRELLRDAWGWRLVTVSPKWSPNDARETSPAGLRQRHELLHGAIAAACARRYDVSGLAAWAIATETSDGGHVHAHALVYGPWIHPEALARMVAHELARECFVDVRKARARDGHEDPRAATREALKYALKGPSPRRAAWVLGEHRATVASPELGAAIVVGLARLQLVRYRGAIREGLRLARLRREKREQTPPQCASCGTVLRDTDPETCTWSTVVAELRRRGEWATAERPRAPTPADRLRWLGPLSPESMPVRVVHTRGRLKTL